MLERWLSHHLAELMLEAEQANGPAKVEAETRAADLILRIWTKRRELPPSADPLGDYRKAIEVLSRLMPEANPWAALSGRRPQEQVLHDLFDCMARIVVGGLILTLAHRLRALTAAEKAAMEPEELALRQHLDRWAEVIRPALPEIAVGFVGPGEKPDAVAETAAPDAEAARDDATGQEDEDEDEPAPEVDRQSHLAVIAGLERMQKELGALTESWKSLPY